MGTLIFCIGLTIGTFVGALVACVIASGPPSPEQPIVKNDGAIAKW